MLAERRKFGNTKFSTFQIRPKIYLTELYTILFVSVRTDVEISIFWGENWL